MINRIVVLHICVAMFIFLLAACGSAPVKQKAKPEFVTEEFTAPLDTPLKVTIGDGIYSRGQVAFKKSFKLSQRHKGTMPGAGGIPFSYSIEPSVLEMRFARGSYNYYCADDGNAAASFPGLGSVIEAGDCVGIREHQTSGKKEWVVDNSKYNGQTTVWHRKYKEGRDPDLHVDQSRSFESGAELTEIRFDGYYSGLLHFTLLEHSQNRSSDRDFKFDYPPVQGEAVYGIQGQVFEVIEISNTGMTYKWKQISSR